MQDNLIDQGISLMLFGMGTVFVFLTILVLATWLMSTLINKFALDTALETPNDPPSNNDAGSTNTPSPQIMDAIKQAIATHRQR